MITMKLLILSLFVISSGVTEAAVKTWNITTNFEKKSNWDVERLPCSKDKVFFDSDSSAVLLLFSGFSFQEVVLPRNGEIILTSKAVIGISSSSTCEGEDVHYIAGDARQWLNPANWKIDSEFLLNSPSSVAPMPHIERIPCQYDSVIFPDNSSFQVALPGRDQNLKMSSLKLNGESYTTEDFNSFRQTQTGKKFFKGIGQLSVSKETCQDATGCACTNNQMQSDICGNVKCEIQICSDPLNLGGHCCPICGSSLEVKYNSSKFHFRNTKDFMSTELRNPQYKNVGCYLWKTAQPDSVWALCLDRDSDHKSQKLINSVYKKLLEDLSKDKITMRVSTDFKESDNKSDKGVIALLATFLGIMLCILLVVGAFFVYRKYRNPDLNFVRFDREVSKVVMELGTTPHEDLEPIDPPSQASQSATSEKKMFKNPIFSFKAKTEAFKGYTDMSNPIYGIEEENEGE